MYFKNFSRAVVTSVLAISFTGFSQDKAPEAAAETQKEPAIQLVKEPTKEDLDAKIKMVSFSHGHYIGTQLKSQKEFLNSEEFIKGLQSALADEKNPNSEADIRAAMQVIQEKMQEAQMKKMAAEKEINIKMIAAFLEEKLEKTASGLEYKVIKMGEGVKPKATDYVTVHYTGYLTDGSKFDSTADRGQPATFPLDGVIKGWTEGVQLMPIGSKFRFKIPAELAYGEKGSGGVIPPNAVLVFDVELISIEK